MTMMTEPRACAGERRTLQRLVMDALAVHGERPAVLAFQKQGVDPWTYERLADDVRRLANRLAGLAIGRGDRVALFAENSPKWIVAALAILRTGATVVPIDAQFGDESLAHALNDSQARVLFTLSRRADRLAQLDLTRRPRLVFFDDWEDGAGFVEGHNADFPEAEAHDQAVLFYTSGTTGKPKGVPLTHANVLFEIGAVRDTGLVRAQDRMFLPLPLHHVYPFVIGMLVPLSLGLPVILPHALTGPQIVRALREGEVTIVLGVPRLYSALVAGLRARMESRGRLMAAMFEGLLRSSIWLRRNLDVPAGGLLLAPVRRQVGPAVRVMASGGAALEPEIGWTLEGLGWPVAIGYGLTETSPLLTLNPPGSRRLDSVGRPIPGVEVRIESGIESSPGEVLARGPNVFGGYHQLPEETRRAFTSGWFHTGDLGWFDDGGWLHLAGRASTLIVMEGGENVQPEEVEEAYATSEVIREVGVLQRNGRLVGVIVPEARVIAQGNGEKLEQQVRDAVKARSRSLPSYQRLSDYVITHDPLPRTRLGKIQRHKLQERYTQAKQENNKQAATRARGPLPVEEMDGADRALLEDAAARRVWDWLAKRHSDKRLTPDTSPQLDLGVDSMEWLNLTLEIGEHAGVELSEEVINEVETVRDLLQKVVEASEAGTARYGSLPLEKPEESLTQQQKGWLEPLGPIRAGLAVLFRGFNWLVLRGVFRLRVEGRENLPDAGPFILTPNHVSYLDPFAVAAALGNRRLRQTYWAGWTGAAFRNAVFRFASRLGQAVPIDPNRAVVSSLAFCAAVLKNGRNLVWFPEGQRSEDGKLRAFKPGIGMLLEHFDVPVVPVYIRGTYEAWPAGRLLPRPGRVTVIFDKPVRSAGLAGAVRDSKTQERIAENLRQREVRLIQEH
jgi:long-chain acyl-CoA synthetase